MNKLNIGCGRDYKEGWWNSDIGDTKCDAKHDIRTDVLPFKDGEVERIYISGVLEQILENEHFIHAMNECHRVLKNGGVMEVVVPNARFAIAHQDPMDVRKFTKETFNYFLAGHRAHTLYGSIYGFAGWSRITIDENERHIFVIEFIK